MAYVRKRGNQLAIVHGERDPETGKVEQRILFTIYSKPEAIEAMGRGERGGRVLRDMLAEHYPGISLNWKAISKGIADNLGVLPEAYEYEIPTIRGRFEQDMLAFTRQLVLADDMDIPGARNPVHEDRRQLEYVADLLRDRLETKDEKEDTTGWDPYGWRVGLRGRRVPVGAEQHAEALFEHGEYRKAETAFEMLIACFPEYAEGHNYLGLIALHEQRLEDAIRHFERTIEVGRRQFPKRIGRKKYWNDHATRPYMRGLSNLASTLGRLGKYDEALGVIDRMDQECGDVAAAATLRAPILLKAGRWREAAENAERVSQVWPEDSLVAALARFEMADGERALADLLHALVNHPRATRMVLGLPLGREKPMASHDHRVGIALLGSLAGYLGGRPRASVRFFREVLRDPRVQRIEAEIAEAERRWHTVPEESRQVAGHIYHEALKPAAASKRAKDLADLVPASPRAILLPPGTALN